jgi:hypothetical protein
MRCVGILVNFAPRQDVGLLHANGRAAQGHGGLVGKIQTGRQLAFGTNAPRHFQTTIKRARIVAANHQNPAATRADSKAFLGGNAIKLKRARGGQMGNHRVPDISHDNHPLGVTPIHFAHKIRISTNCLERLRQFLRAKLHAWRGVGGNHDGDGFGAR